MATPSTSAGRSGAGTDLKREAKNVKNEAKEAAADLKNEAADAAEDRARQGKKAATGALNDVADALHAGADELRDHDRDQFAQYADMAADQVEQFVGSVRDKSVGELMDEAERFARRDPGLFIGGAFLLGVFGARFLKASSPDRFDRRSGGSGFGHRAADPYRYRAGYGRGSSYGRGDYDRGAFGRSDYGQADYGRSDYDRGAFGRSDYRSAGAAASPTGVTGATGQTGVGGALAGAAGTGGTIGEGAGAGVSRSATDNPTGR